ncbi:MAG: hypothetical protein Q4E31_00165 [Intestinibacter bartlettii]|uniref:hypothetical protein n=1 Tax=Intestinibacter bartlettii TaxID=261299 RepID=UPI0026EA9048|nr:hypothetical protein [Intestinibacter bartlettii]MDO5009211.1 hypothetical protein [Intestinibacter bartlettii]
MKLLKKNKSLCFLLIVSVIYVAVTLLYINPLREKNNKLEEKKSEILTLETQNDYVQVSTKQDKVAEDIVLSMEKSIGDLVDINFINKQYEQGENSEEIVLELNFSSDFKNIFKIDNQLKKLNLKDSIESIKIENSQTEIDENRKVNCTMTFRVV